jgi:hypothetical protein
MYSAGLVFVNVIIAAIIGFIGAGLLTAVQRHEPNPLVARILIISVYLTSALAILARLVNK